MGYGTVNDRVSTYLDEAEAVVRSISRTDVRAVVERLYEGWRDRRTTYIIGNGGSASTASYMTAIGNDISYADVFVEQLKNLLLPKDILIALSGSGNSENIIRATQYAHEVGAFVIGLCGQPGSRLCQTSDAVVTIPAKIICQQEDAHLIINHTIALALRDRIAESA